jgi:hypothetical protein
MSRLSMTVACFAALCGTSACGAGGPSSSEQGGVPAADFSRPAGAESSSVAPPDVSDVEPAASAPDVAPPSGLPNDSRPQAIAYPISRGRSVQWKRSAALEADLMRGLELTRDELCQELGSQSCIRAVHTVALGGNDPFGSGLLRPPAASLSTTPLAIDRVTLSACSQRARADKQGSPKVFTSLDLSGPAPEPNAEAAVATITTLFRRLLARDPKPNEVVIIQELLANDAERMTAEEFATLACFVVASSLESLFF